MSVDEKYKKVSSASKVAIYQGASAITINSGYCDLFKLFKFRIVTVEMQFTLTNPNTESFGFAFSDVVDYNNTQSAAMFIPTAYNTIYASNPYSVYLYARRYCLSLYYSGNTMKGNEIGSSRRSLVGTTYFITV